MKLNRQVIHERTNIVPINKNISTYINYSLPQGEYSLKQNVFDPSKSSPPNDFMIKLKMRMAKYNSSYMNDDRREME
jgi:hypothetical protein